jgi:hypothetical protein
MECSYDLYKSVALRFGLEALYFANDIARLFPPFNDQDVLLMGFNFGFAINR